MKIKWPLLSCNDQNLIFILFLFILIAQYVTAPFLALSPKNFSSIDWTIISVSLISVVAFLIVLIFVDRLLPAVRCKYVLEISEKTFNRLSVLIILAIVSCIVLMGLQAKGVPLVSALLGRSPEEVYYTRLDFDMNIHGVYLLAAYLKIIISSIFLPLIVLYSFAIVSRYRWILYSSGSVVLMAELAKANLFKIAMPLILFFILSKQWGNLKKVLIGSAVLFLATTFLSYGGGYEIKNHGLSSAATSFVQPKFKPSASPSKTNPFLFGEHKGLPALLNRSLWVPYATAKSWFEYVDEHQADLHRPIISNRSLAYIFHQSYVPLERDVFNYQFGQPVGATTGLANTTYFIDALIKYGKWAWLLIAFLTPLTVVYLYNRLAIVPKCMLAFYILSLLSVSFINFLLSGVLIIVPFLFFSVRIERTERVHEELFRPDEALSG